MRSLTSIKQSICAQYEISTEQLVAPDRRRFLVLIRLEFTRRALAEGYSMGDVGMSLNNRTASAISTLLSRKRQMKLPYDEQK